MLIHKTFLYVWLIELVVIPIIVLIDIGFSFDIKSNFYVRFGHITALLLALYYLAAVKKKLILHPLNIIFLTVLVIGLMKGLYEGLITNIGVSGSPVVFSHIFYVIMPIIMISYGWYFIENYKQSEILQKIFKQVMIWSFASGFVVVIIFQFAYQAGFASYNAIGMWNFFFAAPYFLYGPYGPFFFGIASLATFLAGKRSVVIIFVLYAGVYHLLHRGRLKVRFTIMGAVILLPFILYTPDFINTSFLRIETTLSSLVEGKVDEASAGRWSEAESAIGYLTTRLDHVILGAGFGAQFLPWPDLPLYQDYYSHYTHFGFVSYIWIGGVFLPIAVYFYLIVTGLLLFKRVNARSFDKKLYFIVYWLWGIIVISLLGAVLMNNPYLWFIIGCSLNLARTDINRNRSNTYV